MQSVAPSSRTGWRGNDRTAPFLNVADEAEHLRFLTPYGQPDLRNARKWIDRQQVRTYYRGRKLLVHHEDTGRGAEGAEAGWAEKGQHMRAFGVIAIIIGVLAAAAGVLNLSNATAGVGGIAAGCFFAIIARICHASAHHDDLVAAVRPKAAAAEDGIKLGDVT